MKRIIAIAIATAFAIPAFAQQKSGSPPPDSQSSTPSNAALTTKVKTALASDVGLSTFTSIDVDSDEGVVTLKGKVDSANTKKWAEEVAKTVAGVKSVKNELKVEPAKDKSS